jgi:hypothetical protein
MTEGFTGIVQWDTEQVQSNPLESGEAGLVCGPVWWRDQASLMEASVSW